MLNYFIPNKYNKYKPYLLRTSALAVYTLIILCSNIFFGGFSNSNVFASTISSDNLIYLTNLERGRYGLNDLKLNPKLTSAAVAKANNMFSEQYWDHFGPNGESPWTFIGDSGYIYVYAGENLAKGFKTAEGVIEGWLASPTHRDNMLSGNYTDVGFAIVSGNLLGENTILVVEMLGNTTTNVLVSPPVYEPVSQSEVGETSSIRIEKPEEGILTNERALVIEGEVSGVSGEYTLNLLDNDSDILNMSLNEEEWEISKDYDWSEGDHNIEVQLYTTELKDSDTVSFRVDSTPPGVDLSTLLISNTDDGWSLSVFIDDPESETTIVVGEQQYVMELGKDGYTNVFFEEKRFTDKVQIVSSDEIGNVSIVDITAEFDEEDGEVLGEVVSSVDLGRSITIGIILFVFILLLMEMYTYFKKQLVHQHGSNLLTVGVWWMLLVFSILTGFSGTIV